MIKHLIDGLNALLTDENLTDAKLREASEGLLPNLADYLNGSAQSDGVGLILAERIEQIHKHGRTVASDVKQNNQHELSFAAALLSCPNPKSMGFDPKSDYGRPAKWDKRIFNRMMAKTYRERLIIAGALIAAEIDRLDYNTKSNK